MIGRCIQANYIDILNIGWESSIIDFSYTIQCSRYYHIPSKYDSTFQIKSSRLQIWTQLNYWSLVPSFSNCIYSNRRLCLHMINPFNFTFFFKTRSVDIFTILLLFHLHYSLWPRRIYFVYYIIFCLPSPYIQTYDVNTLLHNIQWNCKALVIYVITRQVLLTQYLSLC